MPKTTAKKRRKAPRTRAIEPAIPRAIVPQSIVEQTKAFTAPRGRLEMGGVLVGHVDEDGNNVVMAGLFPKQTEEEPGYCEFEGKWMAIACAAADHANEAVSGSDGSEVPTLRVIGWIHTHPGLDIFLSGTDVDTYQQMQRNSPDDRFVAVVVDPLMEKNGVFLTPDKPNTFSIASGQASLDGFLRERYLSFLARLESVRERLGREELPFIITGDLHRDHISRGFVDDYMTHKLDSIHHAKMEINGIKDDISTLSSDISEIRRGLREITSEFSQIRKISHRTRENEDSISAVERSLNELQMEVPGISSRIGEIEDSMKSHSVEISKNRRGLVASEHRIDSEISTIINDMVELNENQERDRSNILQAASVISGLERSIEVQGIRNQQLGDIVEKIGSQARTPKPKSRRQMERQEWDELARKLEQGQPNREILREHFGLIAMNQRFCAVALKRIRKKPQATSNPDKIERKRWQQLSIPEFFYGFLGKF